MATDWPILLDQAAMCRFTSLAKPALARAIAAGRLPVAREFLPGHFLWHRDEVQRRLAMVFNLGSTVDTDEKANQVAEDALNARRALAARELASSSLREGRQGTRQTPPVLPASRSDAAPRRPRGIPIVP